MAVPYTFSTATGSLPLSQLDSNFSTAITIGNTAVVLGDSITTINNLTLANVAITSVSTAFPNGYLANSNVIVGTTTLTLGSTVTSINGLSLSNVTISSGNVTISNVTTTNVTATTANVTTANVGTLVVIGNTTAGGNVTITGNVSAANGTFTSANISGTSNISTLVVTGTSALVGVATLTANPVLSAGTANGVTYLNGSKSLTSGSALTFDGTTLTVTGTETLTSANAETKFNITNTGTGGLNWWIGSTNNSSGALGGGRLAFYDQTSNASRMVIDNAGNVGIGTSSPSGKLNVAGGANSNDLLTSSTGTTYLIMGNVDGTANAKYAYIASASQYLLFGKVNDDLATRTEYMRIDNSGNVGIGTSSPANGRLDVVTSSGAAYINVRRNSQSTGEVGFTLYGGTSSNNWSMYMPTSSNDIRFNTAGVDRVTVDSSGNAYIETGLLWQYAPTPTTKAAAATLTAAELSTDIITLTGTTYTITLPTGTALDTYYSTVPTTNIGYDFHIVNTASGIITIAVGASGMTSVGLLTVAATVSAHFRLRRTAANTYILYRLS